MTPAIPAITNKVYHALVSKMILLPFNDPERLRLSALQQQLSEAQQELFREKKLDVWLKAGTA